MIKSQIAGINANANIKLVEFISISTNFDKNLNNSFHFNSYFLDLNQIKSIITKKIATFIYQRKFDGTVTPVSKKREIEILHIEYNDGNHEGLFVDFLDQNMLDLINLIKVEQKLGV